MGQVAKKLLTVCRIDKGLTGNKGRGWMRYVNLITVKLSNDRQLLLLLHIICYL